MDTIYTKYFKGLIRYEGIQRIDNYPIQRNILREAILNSIVHKDYSTGNPIQIRVYDDKVIIYNDCQIPPTITPESLLEGIGSMPHNPLIAGAFFRSGQIEAWGRGIEKMKRGCITDNLPEPIFTIRPTTFSVLFSIRDNNKAISPSVGESSFGKNYGVSIGMNNGINFGINRSQKRIIELMSANPTTTASQIAESIGISKRQVEANISKLRSLGMIERVGARRSGYWIVKRGNR
jgi:ATP-dependent DNA helicase RecG